MSRTNSEIRVTPSVLDRLIDLDPLESREAAKSRSAGLQELKASVRRDLEWLLPNLETIFRPLWIDDFWNPRYTIRDDIAHFPWSLLIGFVYQVVLWRFVRRMAYTRSRTDLPRLSKEDKIEETDDLQVDAQISPAIGNP